ncbi:MAG: LamG-like jellyroll fold domain-containing protein [Polaribacter sp.]
MKKITLILSMFIIILLSNKLISQNAMRFDGTDDYIEVPSTALNSLNSDNFTFEAWVQGLEADQDLHPMIFSSRESGGGTSQGVMFGFHARWGGASHKMLYVQLEGRNYFVMNNGSAGSILDGNCHHVAISREENTLLFFVDGVQIGTRSISGNPTTVSSGDMSIGRDVITSSSKFDGKIGQVRIWDHTRSSSEITSTMNTSISGSTSGLLGYWEFTTGSGQTAIDKTGTANGQLGSTASVDNNDPEWDSLCDNIIEPEPTDEGAYCCEGENLVENGNFESGNTGFTSDYIQSTTTYPGEYDVTTTATNFNAKVSDHSFCEDPTEYANNDQFMVVNGKTQQPGGTTSVIWEQTISIQPEKEYKFCANFKNMPQCTFSITPEVQIEINGQLFGWNTINTDETDPCNWQKISECFTGENDQVKIKIHIKECGNGDGNDLAIDDISVQEKLDQNLNITVQHQANPKQITASINTISTTDDTLLVGQECEEQNGGYEHYWFVYEPASYPVSSPISSMVSNSWSWSSNLGGSSTQLSPASATNPVWNLTTTFPNYNFEDNKLYVIGLYVPSCCESCYDEGWTYQLTYNSGRQSSAGYVLTKEDKEYLKSMFRQFDQSAQTNDPLDIKAIQMYPNPTNSILNIKTKEAIKSYQIHDVLGKVVKSNPFNKAQIDVSKLQSNIYFITFETENGKKETYKFIKE